MGLSGEIQTKKKKKESLLKVTARDYHQLLFKYLRKEFR